MLHVEAESFAKMSGICVHGCITGGKQVYFQKNLKLSWIDHALDAPEAGVYGLTVGAATPNHRQIIDVSSGADKLATVNVPSTHGLWGTTPEVDLELSKGARTLRLSTPCQRGVAVRWFELRSRSGRRTAGLRGARRSVSPAPPAPICGISRAGALVAGLCAGKGGALPLIRGRMVARPPAALRRRAPPPTIDRAMARIRGRDGPREGLVPVRAPLEVASGRTPRSLRALAPTDEVLAKYTEKRLRERIAAFAPPAIYVPVAAPAVVGALVSLRLRDRTRAVGEVVWSRRELPLSGVAVRYVPADLPGPAQADGSDAWERLIGSPGTPELPPAAAAVLRVAAKPGAGAAELAKAVSADPELAEAVVDLANSADYRAPERIKDVRGAVVRLGLERVRSLVLASSVFRLFPADSGQAGAEPRPSMDSGRPELAEGRVSPAGLWTHALAAAFSAEAVARLAGTPSEDAFLAGLFHDLGKLLLAGQLPGPYAAVLDRVEESGVTLAEAESETLGFTHARAGAWLLSKWGLPGSVVTAVSGHHPQPAGGAASSRLTSWVHVGDLVARALAAGSTADRRLPVAHAPFWEALGIGPGEVALVVRRSAEGVAAGSGVFQEAGVRAPFLPQAGEATEADPILRGAAEAAAARRREELFASARGPAGLGVYQAALLAGAEALVTGGLR